MKAVMIKVLMCVALVGSAAWMTGCLAAAAAAGTGLGVAYAQGDLEGTVDADRDAALLASEGALQDLGYQDVSVTTDGPTAKVFAQAGEDDIKVNIREIGPEKSKVSVRVGAFGDEEISRAVYDQIRANLGLPREAEAFRGAESGA